MLTLAPNLKLPAEIAGRRTAVFGISGSGKSNTATVLTEGLLAAGEQVVLIDPKGESWGLLSTASGKPSNLDLIIFGEPNGHIEALNETHGPKLADFVFESGRSVALSLLGFESDASERRFVATFLRHLYRRKSKHAKKTRTLVVFDEAHLFVPEGARGDQAELAGAVQRIARQGRTFGLGSLFVDQRPQDVSKRVVTQVDTIICHQLVHNTDRAALSEWVKGYDIDGRGKTFLDSLASLQPGEAWVWSPAWLKIFQRTKVNRRKTFDSGAAPDEATATKVQRAEIDLDTLRGQLEEIVQKAKADDPKELRRQIAELRKQLGSKQPAAADPAAIERAVSSAVARRDSEWQATVKDRERVIGEFKGRLGKIESLAHVNGEAVPRMEPPASVMTHSQAVLHSPAPKSFRKPERSSVVSGDDQQLSKAERAILTACYWLKDEEATPAKVGFYADYTVDGGSFKNAIGRLRTTGLVRHWSITSEGAALAETLGVAAKPDGPQLREWLRRKLGKAENSLLDALCEAFPQRFTPEALGAVSGYEATGGSFKNALGRLRTLEAAEGYERDGGVKASDVFFEGA